MAVSSGKDGTVTFNSAQVLHVTQWTLNHTSNNSAWGSSNTAGYKNRVGGTKDWNGSFQAKFDSSVVPTVGQSANMALLALSGKTASGTAIIDSVNLVVDIDNGEAIGYTMNFSGNGALTMPS